MLRDIEIDIIDNCIPSSDKQMADDAMWSEQYQSNQMVYKTS